MPAIALAAVAGAAISTGIGVAAGTITAATWTTAFWSSFAASAVLGGVSKTLGARPIDEHSERMGNT